MKKIFNIVLIGISILILVVLSLQSLQYLQESNSDPAEVDLDTWIEAECTEIKKEPVLNINDLPFQDNMDLYQYDDPDSVVTMYVTVREGNSADNSDHSWQEVNDFTKFFAVGNVNTVVGKTEAILQIGDENGPIPGELGYGDIVPNATIRIRGNTASRAPQKSYKIELFNSAGEWRGQSTIALNKHSYDILRLRNKLCFDLIRDLDDFVSLRTQFVHLYVKDETSDPPSDVFVDYGLFTQIEQPNRAFLRNHLLDQDGQLYKPNMFEFFRYPDEIKLVDDPLYDLQRFETILEVKGNQNHSKLIKMLEDVNNWNIPIEEVFETYFNADNYFTWMAFNIIIGDVDTESQNFYLYSPQNSQTWYFLPWDYDGAFARQEEELYGRFGFHPFQEGIANYWGSVLHKRVLTVPAYRAQLDEKINQLLEFITPELIAARVEEYRQVTDKFVSSMPDILHLYATPEEYEFLMSLLPEEIEINHKLYLESLEKPMPFFLDDPKIVNGKLRFNWEEAYDLDAQDITYTFRLSTSWDLKEAIYEVEITNFTTFEVDLVSPGEYFWQVVATNEDGKERYPFDYYRDVEGDYHYGMRNFYLSEDNQILFGIYNK